MEVVVEVERVGIRGDGVAQHEGMPIYLPFTAPCDLVRARLGERRGAGRSAHAVEFLAQGPRAAPACPHFGACGGCALQHLAASSYLAAKSAWLEAALGQHGLACEAVAPPLLLPAGTRRRARLALRRPRQDRAPAEIGFHARASHRIVDMRACAVLHPSLLALVQSLRALAPALLPPGGAAAASVTLAATGIDLLLDLPAAPALAALEAMASFAAAQDLARLSWRAPGLAPVPVAQHRPVRIAFAGIMVDLPEEVFLQASAEADAALSLAVLDDVGAATRIADLFAGIGTLTFALAQRGAVHAVDAAPAAVAALRAAAARAGLAGSVRAELRDLDAEPLTPDELAPFDAVVFDPPRAGARAQARALAASHVARIVAVSCNPATFARDARTLFDGGYRLTRVQPIDSFLWSPHLELVARFERA
jgi:23S rRNA (uracil1939-C5)-methyltransferase